MYNSPARTNSATVTAIHHAVTRDLRSAPTLFEVELITVPRRWRTAAYREAPTPPMAQYADDCPNVVYRQLVAYAAARPAQTRRRAREALGATLRSSAADLTGATMQNILPSGCASTMKSGSPGL